MKSAIAFLIILLMTEVAFVEEDSGYWEPGAGISYLQSPYYLGSDESKNYVLLFPHILVHSEKFSVEGSSVHWHVLSTDRFEFDQGDRITRSGL